MSTSESTQRLRKSLRWRPFGLRVIATGAAFGELALGHMWLGQKGADLK